MKKRKFLTGFHGPLAEPVFLDVFESHRSGQARARKKLEILATHYGQPVDKTGEIDWREVCFRMGTELGVPGLQVLDFMDMPPVKLARGAPKKIPDWSLLQAVAKIQNSSKRPMKVSRACQRLSDSKHTAWNKRSQDALETQHSRDLVEFEKTYGFKFNSAEHRADWDRRRKMTLFDELQ